MKVKILQAMRGPNVSVNPGDVYECDPDEGARLLSKGIAEPMKRGRPKKAVIEPKEKAVIE